MPEMRAHEVEWWGTLPDLSREHLGADEVTFITEAAVDYGQPWRLGELFYVTDDMTRLAISAARSMPEFEMHRDDLPAEFGVMWFEIPLNAEGDPIHACAWQVVTDRDAHRVVQSVQITFYVSTDCTTSRVTWTRFKGIELVRISMSGGQDQVLIGDNASPEAGQWGLAVRCAWLLMQQRIATVVDHHPDRASARRMARRGHGPSLVRVITLRSPEHHFEPGESGRTYRHRWVVRGHWRKQWYATQSRHVPIWISPHIKGPGEAPLLTGEKVYAWTR